MKQPTLITQLNNPLTTEQYAKKVGLSKWYVRKLCREGKIKCVKVGRDWFVEGVKK